MANRPYDANFEPRPADQARDDDLRFQRFLSLLQQAGLGTRDRAENAAVSVLCSLERRIGGAEARDLNEELPWALRDLLRRCELPIKSRPERFGREELVQHTAEELGVDGADAEHVVRTVLQVARSLLSEKEASDVAAHLPKDMQDLWAPPA